MSNKYCIDCKNANIVMTDKIYGEGKIIDFTISCCDREATNLINGGKWPIKKALFEERINGTSEYGENCGIDAKYFKDK
jgi:hypothetical protein